ncbi:MAG: hypothetical protein WC878_01905 [Candidatus Paceibacterota bacterium]
MAQLVKGMYGSERKPTGDLFGLRCGQERFKNRIIHNGGWYNQAGEKLGWGDLSREDFERISKELDYGGELFIVLNSHDSFWKFTTNFDGFNVGSPGIDYVTKHAQYIILRNQLYKIDTSEKETVLDPSGLAFKVLDTIRFK